MKLSLFSMMLLLAAAGVTCAQQAAPDALSRIFKHKDGKRTETQKMGGSNKIQEWVYDKNSVLCGSRLFNLDEKGRILNSMIYDGKRNAVGSTTNKFDPQTGRMLSEEMRDAKGRKIRELFYPGALKDPRNAKKMIAFSFDPDQPKAAAKQVAGVVQPIVPTTKNEEEFEPGLPQGTAAPTRKEMEERHRGATTANSKAPPRRSWLPQKTRP